MSAAQAAPAAQPPAPAAIAATVPATAPANAPAFSPGRLAIEAEGLVKRYQDHVALDGVNLSVPAGTLLGLLGPNGAGKTTTVRILTTLLRPDAGRARVAGHDVVSRPREVRRRIGLAGQYAAVDEQLTGRENLRLLGTLLHLGRRQAEQRAARLLEDFALAEVADRPLRTYSGGQRRRLDLAGCLVGRPAVLFLDEPTTGLDPVSRLGLWSNVRDLLGEGVTVLLTTQYLEEADQLADRIAVVAGGRVIAEGTPEQLKGKTGQEWLEVTLEDPGTLPAACAALSALALGEPVPDQRRGLIELRIGGGLASLGSAATALHRAEIAVSGFALRKPTLDDVFLQLTGSPGAADAAGAAAGAQPAR